MVALQACCCTAACHEKYHSKCSRFTLPKHTQHTVFMGQGEPLLNLPSVAAAYHLLHDQLGLSGRSITISTVGVPNAISKLAALKLPVTLAVSIHAPSQELREQLIPSAKVYPIQALMVVSIFVLCL